MTGIVARLGRVVATMAVAAGLAGGAAAQGIQKPGPTVDAIKRRGMLACGVDVGVPGFAVQDNAGNWTGLDVAYCKAIAAAVLGDAAKVRYVPTTTPTRFTILQSGEIDVLVRDSTLTFTRSNQLNLDEVAINFYAGQGFLVRKDLGVKAAEQLNGATICTLTGATLELNIADFARSRGTKIGTLLFDKADEAVAAMEAGRCDGYTDDTGSLAGMRSTLKKPDDWIVLEGVISKEPLGIHARSGDPNWSKILYWVDAALKSGEELGITRANAAQLATSSTDPTQKRLLGTEGDFGKLLGLDNDWAVRAIAAVGNYGEIYDQFFGPRPWTCRAARTTFGRRVACTTRFPSGKRLPPITRRRNWGTWLRTGRGRAALWQGVAVLAAGALLLWVASNAADNMARRNLGFGLDFLARPAGFDIPLAPAGLEPDQQLRPCAAGQRCQHAVRIGAGDRPSHRAGAGVALGRLSGNPLLTWLSRAVIELVRNTPQLVQIVFWYFAVLQVLPAARNSIFLGGAVLNVRGLFLPGAEGSVFGWMLAGSAIVALLPRLPWRLAWCFRWPGSWQVSCWNAGNGRCLRGFNFVGGVRLPPELLALTLGIGIYASAFVAETMRGSIQGVAHGQVEAARSLGLTAGRAMRLVVLPQALRTMLPPLTSQYLNVIKSSTLGAAIAFPEAVQIFARTVLNQSGRAIEVMTLLLGAFLVVNLSISAAMAQWNARLARRGQR